MDTPAKITHSSAKYYATNDFFHNYGDVSLPDGAKAKIAFYFKTQEHLDSSHQHIQNFVIVKNTGEFYIVEIKSENERNHPDVIAKKKAVQRLAQLQPDAHFAYKVIYTRDAFLQEDLDEMQTIREWIYAKR